MYELIVLSSVVKALRSQTDGLEGIEVKFLGSTGTVIASLRQKRFIRLDESSPLQGAKPL